MFVRRPERRATCCQRHQIAALLQTYSALTQPRPFPAHAQAVQLCCCHTQPHMCAFTAVHRRIVCEWLSAEGEERGAAAAAGSGAAAARESAAASDAIEVLFRLSRGLQNIEHPRLCRQSGEYSCRLASLTASAVVLAAAQQCVNTLLLLPHSTPIQLQLAPADDPYTCSGRQGSSWRHKHLNVTANGRLWRRRCRRQWATSWPRRPRTRTPAQATCLRRGSCCASRRAARCVAHAV